MKSAQREKSASIQNPGADRDSAAGDRSSGYVWKTRRRFLGLPLVCVAWGRDERGKRRVAKGHIAIGNYAIGGLAVGQVAVGVFSAGQFALGLMAFGQFALALLAAFGQFSGGFFAVGQFVTGMYAKGQFGWAEYLWSPGWTDMEAVAMFETIDWLVTQEPAVMWEALTDAVKLYVP